MLRSGWPRLAGRRRPDPTGGDPIPQADKGMARPVPASADPSASGSDPAGRSPDPGQGDEDLSTYLYRLRVLTKSWPGESVGEGGPMRGLNLAGSRPPLFWCYNSEHEFGRMAAGLGPDQPLIGMRSLNRIAPAGPEREALARRLADHYARSLIGALDFDRCAVGGNCQSGAIATRMALEFLRRGKRVDLLMNLEATPPVPYPGRVALFFGRESETHNPFFTTARPQDLWQAIHGEVSWTVVPGAHGQYFTDTNIGPLCEAIRHRLAAASEAPPLGPPPEARLVLLASPALGAARSTLVVPARVRAGWEGAGRPFLVRPLWRSESLGSWSPSPGGALSLHRIEAGRASDLVLATPDKPGRWRLRLVLCQEGVGPVAWRQGGDPVLDIDLREETVPA